MTPRPNRGALPRRSHVRDDVVEEAKRKMIAPRGLEQCYLGPSADCFKTGYSRAIVALANVSGALVDAATIPVPEPAQYGNAVRMLSAERDEAVGLLREVLREDMLGNVTEAHIRAFLAKHPEAG